MLSCCSWCNLPRHPIWFSTWFQLLHWAAWLAQTAWTRTWCPPSWGVPQPGSRSSTARGYVNSAPYFLKVHLSWPCPHMRCSYEIQNGRYLLFYAQGNGMLSTGYNFFGGGGGGTRDAGRWHGSHAADRGMWAAGRGPRGAGRGTRTRAACPGARFIKPYIPQTQKPWSPQALQISSTHDCKP